MEIPISDIKECMLLKNVQGMTEAIFSEILERRSTLKNIFAASFDELYSIGVPSIIAENIVKKRYNEAFVDRELALAEKNKVQIIGIEDNHYPPLLKEIPCPPAYLYLKGNPSCLKEPTIAIVGSRKATKAAIDMSRRIAADLASVGITVVSGFATGIDIAAHTGAITKGTTAAVLGSGMLNIYPKHHLKYAPQITEEGCILTEYPFAELPMPYNFPKRNRIISGLSMGVLVAEAAFKSGSLITARFALEQNRTVFAMPHFPGSIYSATNDLIKQGAKLTESYLDIVEEFKNIFSKLIDCNEYADNNVLPNGIKGEICKAVKKEPCTADELCATLNIGIVDFMILAAELEMENYITKNEKGDYIPGSGIFNG